MGRIFIFLLFLCLSLVGQPAHAHSNGAHNRNFVSALTDLHRAPMFQNMHPQYRVKTPLDKEETFSIATFENEDEDDLFRRHSLLARYALAFFYTYFLGTNAGALIQRFPFYQHHSGADSPLYVRLRVFRI